MGLGPGKYNMQLSRKLQNSLSRESRVATKASSSSISKEPETYENMTLFEKGGSIFKTSISFFGFWKLDVLGHEP